MVFFFKWFIREKSQNTVLKRPVETKSAMDLMKQRRKSFRNPQIHMYRNLNDCVQTGSVFRQVKRIPCLSRAIFLRRLSA